MFVTIELLRDSQDNQFFAIDGTRLGKFKPIGIAKTVSKGNVLISDLVEAVGKEDIRKYINNSPIDE